MKKNYPFSIIFISLWIIGILYILPQIVLLNRGAQLMTITALLSALSILFIVSAVGIGFNHSWARRLHIWTSIVTLTAIVSDIVISMVSQNETSILILLYSFLIFSPWICLILYGLYYLNRRDVRGSLGLGGQIKDKNAKP